MSEQRRQSMLQICDGHPDIPLFMYYLQNCPRCDDMLAWLWRNRLTGAKFIFFVRNECGNSPLGMVAELTRRLEKESAIRPMLAGQDYIINRRG